MTNLFAPDIRKRLYVIVQEYPGLHVRELARRLSVQVRAVEYHADILLREGILIERRDGNYHRLFPNQAELPLSDADREALGALRMPVPLGLVLALLDAPDGLGHGELCKRTGASKANASHHLKRLSTAGIVDRENTYQLRDVQRIRTLIRAHKPVPDLRRRFADAWASIYRM